MKVAFDLEPKNGAIAYKLANGDLGKLAKHALLKYVEDSLKNEQAHREAGISKELAQEVLNRYYGQK